MHLESGVGKRKDFIALTLWITFFWCFGVDTFLFLVYGFGMFLAILDTRNEIPIIAAKRYLNCIYSVANTTVKL